MVEQEQGAVRNATLSTVGQIQAVTGRTDLNTKILMARIESREAALERDNLLARLSTLDFHEKHRDIFAKHHQGTGQWLLKTDEFQRWSTAKKPSMLWCPGIPGAGKTVMTSFVVDHIQEAIQGTKAATAYLYCDYKNPKTQSELELLSSVARQLAEQTSSMPSAVNEFCDKNAEKRRNPTGDEWIALIKSISHVFQRTYLFVDALDECPETNRENFLSLISKIEPFVWLFITSRPHVGIEAKFLKISRVDISASDSDIKTYLMSEISTNNRLSLFAAKDVKLKEDIVKSVSEKAAGMFLLPYLQIYHLSKQASLKKVRNTMNALPTEVFASYGEAMKRIEDQQEGDSELARRALSYIFCAKRPLSVEELRHILSMEAEDIELDETAFPETEILLNISAGLIKIDEQSGAAGLVHYTLQEYLEKNREKLLPDPEVEMGMACLTYLSFDVFQGGSCNSGEELHHRLQEYKFLDYASHHWGYHIMENQLHERVVGLLLTFLKSKQKLASSVQILHIAARRTNDWHDRYPKQFGPLHVVAYWGLDKILNVLFETDIDVDSRDSYEATALQIAAKRGHNSVTQLLLNKGASINISNVNGETALYWAARSGHKTTVDMLLINRADVLTKDNEGWTALYWAVVGGNNDVVKMLLEYGANIITAEYDGRHKALYLAAEEGHELTVQMLLGSGANVNAQDYLGSTALDFAAAPGHEKTLQVLLQNGADVNSRDNFGNTVLHWAVPHKTLIRLLLEYAVDLDAKNDSGQSALCWAAQDWPLAVTELLLENNADVNAQDNFGFTALHRATLRGRESTVRLLLENGADPNIKDKDEWTPLHLAALKQYEGLVQVLLDRVDDGRMILGWVDLQLQDKKRQALLEEAAEGKAEASTVLTGLREAAQKRQFGRSQLLLEKGADVNAKDVGGWSALTIAANFGYEEIVQLLLENGADANISGYDKRTALHWASEWGQETVVQLLVKNGANVNASAYGWTAMLLAVRDEYMAIGRFLIENEADVNAEDYHGRTALHWAAKHGDRLIVQLLVGKGIDVNAEDRWGRTALIYAVENMQREVVKMLLETGAATEAKFRHDLTALHIAAFIGFESAVHYLLEGGASVEAKTQDNLTALHIAAFMGWESVVQQLLEKGADVEAEARWCGVEEEEEYDYGVTDVHMAEKRLIDLLRQWLLEEGIATGVGMEPRYGLTARQLAVSAGHPEVQELLG
ncbi:hypothetical protein VC83_07746 [Pseudogymnoascus destructans]|uniref:Uncharacterized protein n=2 Tax=Pseudogymnoascus destructans TaxID=655981 RepID=L8G061_PSED2|nr:uncharacterized protein VC83_07746 [Pseudogymnoascus destructans]ELR06088.1 hypothetical protein GMDG_07799 [Pseudogymnoascus destructans 20631-21]OAF55791.2 hypothetical protein VC83_07746 [Pseudogymnoascus destructans]